MRAFHKIRWSLEQRGFIGTLASAASSLGRKLKRPETRPPHTFASQNGVTTDGVIPGHDLAVGHANDRFIAGHTAVTFSGCDGEMAGERPLPRHRGVHLHRLRLRQGTKPPSSPQSSAFARWSESN